MTLLQAFNSTLTKNIQKFPELRPGMTVRVYQRVTEETEKGPKQRTQAFEGLIIARRGRETSQCSITVRRISSGVGVERIFSLISPTLEKIQVIRQAKVRRAKLYYIRNLRGKASRMKNMFLSDGERSALNTVEQDAIVVPESSPVAPADIPTESPPTS